MRIPAHLRVLAGALLFALVIFHCFFTGLGRVGFVGPDEPRYASIAREMARSGDWVTPRLNGAPWFEKPPLYYWSAAIGFQALASPESAGRAPSGIFALAAVMAIALLALRIYGAETARAAAWMLPATVGMIGFARAAATDMPFTACLALTMCAAACLLIDDAPSHGALWAGVFGVALGLAVLAKGPAAILLAGGSTILWTLIAGNFRRVFRLFHPLALGAFAVVALPWYVLCALRNPEFLRTFLLEQNVERFLTNRYQHQQPIWFFLPILLLAVFPWTLLLIPAARDGWRGLREPAWRKSPAIYFAAWVLFPFVFFSVSQSKLPGYILPAVPPLVILLARTLARDPEGIVRFGRSRVLLVAAALAGGAVAAVIGAAGAIFGLKGSQHAMLQVATALTGGGIITAALAGFHGLRRSAAAAAIAVAFCAGLAANHLLPALDPQISVRTVAAEAAGALPACRSYHLARAWRYGLEFYLQGPLDEWTPGSAPPAWIITDRAGATELMNMGWKLELLGAGSTHGALFRVKSAPG